MASGIVLGFAAAWLFNRTCEKQFYGHDHPALFGPAVVVFVAVGAGGGTGLGFCFVCPPLQRAVSALTGWIAASGNAGVFLYGFLERLLIPTGLHHLIYMPFQFSSAGRQPDRGLCDLHSAYAVCMTEYTMGLPLSDGIVWMYTGFTKTFGYLALQRPSSSRPAGRTVPVPPPL